MTKMLLFFLLIFLKDKLMILYYSIVMMIFMMMWDFSESMSYLLYFLTLMLMLIMIITMMTFKEFYMNYNFKNFLIMILLVILSLSFWVDSFFYFYLFFEFSVVPIYIYIIFYGTSKEKLSASLYLFFYTFSFSLLFLLSLMYYFNEVKTYLFLIMYFTESNMSYFYLLMMILIFLVKLPVFFFHVWLPRAHVESPMGGSMILAGLMLKLGGYGLIKLIEYFYWGNLFFSNMFFSLSLWTMMIMGLVCLMQIDLKRMVAYSSISHMSMVVLGCYSVSEVGKWGSVSIMLAHGISSTILFYMLGVIYYRSHSRNLLNLSKYVKYMYLYSMWWIIFTTINLGFPMTMNFFSEIAVFSSIIMKNYLNLILMFFMIMINSIYSIFLMTSLSFSLEKSNLMYENIKISESIIFLICFLMVIFLNFIMWMY